MRKHWLPHAAVLGSLLEGGGGRLDTEEGERGPHMAADSGSPGSWKGPPPGPPEGAQPRGPLQFGFWPPGPESISVLSEAPRAVIRDRGCRKLTRRLRLTPRDAVHSMEQETQLSELPTAKPSRGCSVNSKSSCLPTPGRAGRKGALGPLQLTSSLGTSPWPERQGGIPRGILPPTPWVPQRLAHTGAAHPQQPVVHPALPSGVPGLRMLHRRCRQGRRDPGLLPRQLWAPSGCSW